MPLPNYLILGETKCGTTSMYDNLIQHPDILPTLGNDDSVLTADGNILGQKEIRYFDKYWSRGIEWYKSCFPECNNNQITGEATPMYLYRQQALQRIATTLKDTKLIVMFRNPVNRLLSHFHHLGNILPDWYERYPTFGDFWQGALEGDYYIIDKGIYWRSLQALLQYFPRKQIYIIRSEDLFSDPDRVYAEALEFLEVRLCSLPKIAYSRQNTYSKITDIKLLSEITDFYKKHNLILEEIIGRKMKWESH